VVPLHSKIIDAGFLEYCDQVKSGPLWPGLKPGGPDGKRSWYVSKRLTDYRRSLGLIEIDNVTKRDRLEFHSLRPSAITSLKHAGVAEHDVAEIVGHEHPRVTFGVYPGRQKLERLKAVVEAIRYDAES
jgi:integrase